MSDLHARLQEGTALYKSGDFEAALRVFRGTASEFPQDPESVFNCGVILDRTGDKEGCVREMRESLRRDPAYAKAALNLAATLAETDDVCEAGAVLRESLTRGVPEWLLERMKECRQMIHEQAFRALLDAAGRLEGGIVNADAIARVGRCLGAFLGSRVSSCDLIVTDRGLRFVLATPAGAFRADFSPTSGLSIREESTGKEVFFVRMGPPPAPEKAPPKGRSARKKPKKPGSK
ncbi:MAG: tetratricopeptide repeat protein [Planctomycetes bacterium]|nr:tetratricopeptide repeat protein [Planctomycetota bacterium]